MPATPQLRNAVNDGPPRMCEWTVSSCAILKDLDGVPRVRHSRERIRSGNPCDWSLYHPEQTRDHHRTKMYSVHDTRWWRDSRESGKNYTLNFRDKSC